MPRKRVDTRRRLLTNRTLDTLKQEMRLIGGRAVGNAIRHGYLKLAEQELQRTRKVLAEIESVRHYTKAYHDRVYKH